MAGVSAVRLAELIRTRQPCVVLTGAGVSTESGIPDFRSPTGIWAEVDPMEYASLRAFREDPEKVWTFYAKRIDMLTGAEPNDGASRAGGARAAGACERRDHAEHRPPALTRGKPGCRRGARLDPDRVLPRVRATHPLDESMLPVPRCDCGAVLKPDVVFFGELLPQAAIDRAYELARSAALMLVVGSALEVYPVADLPLETLRSGGSLAIVNRGETSLDSKAELKIDGSAGETLSAVLAAVEDA